MEVSEHQASWSSREKGSSTAPGMGAWSNRIGLCLAMGSWGRGKGGRAGLCWKGAEGQSRLHVSSLVPEIWQVCILGWRDLAVQLILGEEWVNSWLGCLGERPFLWKSLSVAKKSHLWQTELASMFNQIRSRGGNPPHKQNNLSRSFSKQGFFIQDLLWSYGFRSTMIPSSGQQ